MAHVEEDFEKMTPARLVFDNQKDIGIVLRRLAEIFENEDGYWTRGEHPDWAEQLSDVFHCGTSDTPVIRTVFRSIADTFPDAADVKFMDDINKRGLI